LTTREVGLKACPPWAGRRAPSPRPSSSPAREAAPRTAGAITLADDLVTLATDLVTLATDLVILADELVTLAGSWEYRPSSITLAGFAGGAARCARHASPFTEAPCASPIDSSMRSARLRFSHFCRFPSAAGHPWKPPRHQPTHREARSAHEAPRMRAARQPGADGPGRASRRAVGGADVRPPRRRAGGGRPATSPAPA
jgi:hypothetical protein